MEPPSPDKAEGRFASDCIWAGEQEDTFEYVVKVLREGFPKIIPEEIMKCYSRNEVQGYKHFVKEFDTDEQKLLDELSGEADYYTMKTAEILQKRLVERLKKKYNLGTHGRHYSRPDLESNAKMNRFQSVLNEEWSRLNASIRDKSCINDPTKSVYETKIKLAKKRRRDEDFAKSKREMMLKFMGKLQENKDVCRAALGFINKKIQGTKYDDKDLQKEEENNRRCRSSVMDVISSDRQSLLSMTKIRKSRPKRGFIDECCSICLEKEKDWEGHIDSEPLTAEDAKVFHTFLVRSGGMRNLVDFFRNTLEARVPPELVLPMFIGSVVPQDVGNLYETLANHIKITLEEMTLKWNQKTENKEQKYSLEGATEDDNKYRCCFLCQHKCEQLRKTKRHD